MPIQITDVRVEGISQEQDVDASGNIRDMARVYYLIKETGPYSVVIPKLEMSAQRVLMEIRQDAQRYIDILNLTF